MKYYLIRFKYAMIDRGIRRVRSRTEQDRDTIFSGIRIIIVINKV